MADMEVVGFDSFGEELAGKLGCRFMPIERRIFPDGELCPRIIGKPDGRVILAGRMKLPVDPNAYFVEMMLSASKLKSLGCEVWMVMPYLVYSRQDKCFREGEPLSVKSVIDMFAKAGVSSIFTVSSHADREKSVLSFSNIPAHNIDGYSLLGERISRFGLKNPMVIGADMSVDFAARKVSESMGCRSQSLEKKRDASNGSIMTSGSIDAKGKDIVIVDDIISSGGTMANAAMIAREGGAASITIAAVHVTKQDGIDRLRPLCDRMIATDTIETAISEVHVSEKIAETIRRF